MLKHYVEIYYPGGFFSETSTIEIKNREVDFEIPENCFGYRLFDRTEVKQDGELLIGDRKNISGMVYLGEKYSLSRLKKEFGNKKDYRILISNVEDNGYKGAVKTRRGNWQPLTEKDKVLTI